MMARAGILALMSLLGVKQRRRPVIVAVGLFGAALIYGDGAITPAISVLSALEGLEHSMAVLCLVRAADLRLGIAIAFRGSVARNRLDRTTFRTGHDGWFLAIGLLGLRGILAHPSVLLAINPLYAFRYLVSSPGAFLVLGRRVSLRNWRGGLRMPTWGISGPNPSGIAWSGLVFPALVLSYAGQAALGAVRNEYL